MSSPYTRSMTEEEELMYDAGLMDGAEKERKVILDIIQNEWLEYPDVEALLNRINNKQNLFPQDEVEQVREALGGLIGE